MAGVVPGIVMAIGLIIANYLISHNKGYRGLIDRWQPDELITSIRHGVWALLAPVIILGGIYSGMFTPTESAIVAIFYTLFVGLFLHREMTFKSILKSLRTTTWISGRVLLILFTATVFGRLLVEHRIPAVIAESMLGLTDNIYIVWLIIIGFLLFVGMFMETLAAIMILVPVLLPIMFALGADPTHVGIVVICVLSVGFMTPPLGENLFVTAGISGEKMERIVSRIMPFVMIEAIAIVLIAFVPELSLWLPRLIGY
jgi:C4-dicarboxylate transporter DctM subunit